MVRKAVLFGICALVAACARYTDLPMTPTQDIAQSEDALHRGEYATAVKGFSDYLATGETTFRARAFFELAQAQYGLENYQAALDTLADMKDQFPHERGPQVPALQGDIEYAMGKRSDAIRDWDMAWQKGEDSDRQFLRPRIEATIDEITPAEAAQLVPEVGTDDVRAMLAARAPSAVAAAEHHKTDAAVRVGSAKSESAKKLAGTGESPAAEEAAALGAIPPQRLTIGAGDALDSGAEVACLLPLSGADRTYGQRALSGLRLAFSGFPNMLVVRDTEGRPDLAAQLVTALASDPAVVALIGPLRSSDASVVAPLAERLQMPMLLLARDEGLSGPFVLQATTTQQEQVQILVTYTVHTLGLTRLAVLYPDDAYGRAYMTAFRTAAINAGALDVKTNVYHSDQPSFAQEAAVVKSWVTSDGVQAVFIPDAASTAVKVAAAAREAAPQIQLLGTESWNQPDVLASAGRGIDGAVFADSFFIGSGTPSTADFVTRFRAQNGYDPSGFEARAYDAGMLVREAIAQGGRSRGAVLQYLRGVSGYQGAGSIASGATDLKPDLVLLQVRDGRVDTVTR
jgi:ABC-type branched-subunit amino acid transport system substrate-binding protein